MLLGSISSLWEVFSILWGVFSCYGEFPNDMGSNSMLWGIFHVIGSIS